MEKLLTIRLPNTKYILYGILRGSLQKPLVVFVHGLGEHMDGMLQYNAAHYFAEKGFATFRFNLYDWRKGARKLHDCTLQTNADDIDTVVAYFRKRGVKKIFVVGHSYGGPAILLSQKRKMDAAALWDPSNFANIDMREWVQPVPELHQYKLVAGYEILISRKVIEFERALDWNNLTCGWEVPLKIIGAGNGILQNGCKAYHAGASGPKELVIIKGAGHFFSEERKLEKLFRETEKWLRRF